MELIAPAGDLTKLKYALTYGADAVYCGVPRFSLRGRVNSFTHRDLALGVSFAHKKKKKVYFTYNIYPHNRELDDAKKHLLSTVSLAPDALVISDPGLLSYVRSKFPRLPIHVSTQANTINYGAVDFWKKQGVKRVILAREVTLVEARQIKERVKGIELEYFVHGAMCMALSGRCLLSSWINQRSANSGECTQPCRWPWNIREDVLAASDSAPANERAKNRSIILEEDEGGTYFMNSKDLCLIGEIGRIEKSGIDALKIEGRNKSLYYLSTVVKYYRDAIDTSGAKRNKIVSEAHREFARLGSRDYTTGFAFGMDKEIQNYETSRSRSAYYMVGEYGDNEEGKSIPGEISGASEKGACVYPLRVHNVIKKGEVIDAIDRSSIKKVTARRIYNHKGEEKPSAHGGTRHLWYIELDRKIYPWTIFRSAANK